MPVFCSKGIGKLAEDEFRTYNGRYVIVVNKKKFQLHVFSREKGEIKVCKIGYGKNPDLGAKQYEGDDRTPEGRYAVNEILSMDASAESPSYKKLKKMNEHYFYASKGYHKISDKNEDLGDNAYGPRFFGIDYPNERDRDNYNNLLKNGKVPVSGGRPAGIGYGIAIHGNNDEISIGTICSSGCIRMYNRDIVELEQYIVMGTPVLIVNF